MDKGAHFYKCDFQVHTPRDLRWNGTEAVTDDERKKYAQALISACREKKLDAIAITDHHDMLFAKYVRQAALEEVNQDGAPVQEKNRIVVFPGMELTLSVPCQALILFDADFPDDMFSLAITALAINQSDDSQSRTAQVERLNIRTITALKESLDKHEYLRGKYIILPNVSEGGSSTLLRSGFASEYKSMPCVGGYVDGSIAKFGNGNRGIVSGKNKEYGYKKIALFQTSDNRRENHADLGVHTTWVKWAKPTAEALRQACLADDSRLSQDTPQLPQLYITKISISNSKFLGPLNLDFNHQFNAIIGGRGTGKSSILEYLRWALCDEPALGDDDEGIDFQAKRRKLIEKTLLSLSSNIQVEFIKNDVKHTLRRSASEKSILLKIGEGEFEQTTEEQIRSILPIQAYSQKQLSSVGIRIDQLRRFVEAQIQEKLDTIIRKKNHLKQEIRQSHTQREKLNLLNKNKDNLIKEIASLSGQSKNLRNKLTGLSDDDNRLIIQKSIVDEEKSACESWKSELDSLLRSLEQLEINFSDRPRKKKPHRLANEKQIELLFSALEKVYTDASESIKNIRIGIVSNTAHGSTVSSQIELIDKYYANFEDKYNQAKERSQAHQSTLTQLEQIETRLKELQIELTKIESEIESLGDVNSSFDSLLDRWFTLDEEITQLISQQCDALTQLSDGMIRAYLDINNDFSSVLSSFQKLIKGTNLRSNKIEELINNIATSKKAIEKWRELLSEIEIITSLDTEQPIKSFTGIPNIKAYFSDSDIQKLALKIKGQDWLELALSPIQSTPKFEYKAREKDYIPFEDASAGQQATALLWALLNQDGPPLVIDQPEDDLDSQVITKIVQKIWISKGKRQLICSSHNANLVVNGDAELVVCCDYRTAGEQSSGHIKTQGAIDIPEVRNEITKIMEGGIEAFKLRKEKYGF